MIRIAHLLNDFAMGGVTRALSLFTEEPRMTSASQSFTVPMRRKFGDAPSLDADLILIHVPPCWSRLPYLAALRLRNPQARIVQVEHSYTRSFERYRVSSRKRFRLLLRSAAKLVDEVVAVSKAQAQWLAETGIPRHKISTIYPWSGRFELLQVPEKRFRSQRLNLLAYGRFSREKNFDALITAMRQFHPSAVELVLFGSGPEQENLNQLARDCPNVRIKAACTDPAPWLAQCSAVIMPSHHEAFGLVATEARMAARPILVADVDGLPEQAEAGGGVVAKLGSHTEIADAIREFLNFDLLRLGREAREGVIGQHDVIIDDWLDLVNRAASHRRNPKLKAARAETGSRRTFAAQND